MTIFLPDRRLWPRATKREPGANSKRKSSSVSFSSMTCSAADGSFGSSMSAECDALFPQERSAFAFGERNAPWRASRPPEAGSQIPAACAGPPLPVCPPALHAAHKRPAPAVRCRVADCAEHRRVGRRVKRAGTKLSAGSKRTVRNVQASRVVFEGRAFLILPHAGPQPPHRRGNAVQVHIHKTSLSITPFVRFGFRVPRIRWAGVPLRAERPTGSFFGSARSPGARPCPSQGGRWRNPERDTGSPFQS